MPIPGLRKNGADTIARLPPRASSFPYPSFYHELIIGGDTIEFFRATGTAGFGLFRVLSRLLPGVRIRFEPQARCPHLRFRAGPHWAFARRLYCGAANANLD
jgi:hypothetical protein